jgi:hypothetical protein
MRNERQHTLDRAVISALRQVNGRLVPEAALVASVSIKTDWLAPTKAEIDDAIRHAENENRILGVSVETGRKFQITDEGEAWALKNKL